MIEENDNDGQILKDIFLKSLELSDPAKKLEKIKIDPPSGRLFFAAVGKGAGRIARAFEKSYQGKADGIVVIPENEKCPKKLFSENEAVFGGRASGRLEMGVRGA